MYSRRQIVVLLVVVGVAGVGLAIGEWRRAYPDLVERVERFDQEWISASADAVPITPPWAATPSPATPDPPPGDSTATVQPRAGAGITAPVDVNRATVAELIQVPGVGAAMAARIVEARELDGPFASVDDLRRVRGLGRSKLQRLREFVTVAR